LQSEWWRCQYWSAYVTAAPDGGWWTARLVKLAVRVVVENDGEIVDAFLLYWRLGGPQYRCGQVYKISPP